MPSPTPTFTLSNFPSWQSTPALTLARPPSLLMAIDKGSSNRELAGIDDAKYANSRSRNLSTEDSSEHGESPHPVIRIRPVSRPRSFLHILEEFQEESLQVTPSPSTSHSSAQTDESVDVASSPLQSSLHLSSGSSIPSVASFSTATTSLPTDSASRIEDTARRRQRISLPTVGLQTTPVTARANAKGEGLAKRFSLVLGVGRTIRGPKSTCVDGTSLDQGTDGGTVKQSRSTGHGVAASRLANLLGRRKGA
jgi:FYVE/RhoGEF/PH domain-containing protein 5/6